MTFLLYNQSLWVFLMLLHFGTYPKLAVHALIHDPQKKNSGHQLGPMPH